MTFLPRKGLEVDLSPHLTNARRRLEDLPKWPAKIEAAGELADYLKAVANAMGKVVHAVSSLPPRVQTAIDNSSTDENEAAGQLLLDEVELAIHQAEHVRDRVQRGREILKRPLEARKAAYLSKSLEREVRILADEHLMRVEDAATVVRFVRYVDRQQVHRRVSRSCPDMAMVDRGTGRNLAHSPSEGQPKQRQR